MAPRTSVAMERYKRLLQRRREERPLRRAERDRIRRIIVDTMKTARMYDK